MHPRARPDIAAIHPYTPGVAQLPGVNRVIKLSSNEGAFGPPPGVAEAIARLATRHHRYPDSDAAALRTAIGARFGLDPARIVCGAGSDDLLFLLCHIYGGPLGNASGRSVADGSGRSLADRAGARVTDVNGGLSVDAHSGLSADVHSGLSADVHSGLSVDVHSGLSADAYSGLSADVTPSELIMTAHGFSIYEIAGRLAGCRVIKAPERELTTDVDAILAAVTPATRLVFIANPNNPTGTFIPTVELQRLRHGLPPDVLLVLDAAYAEYVDRPDYNPGTALVDAGGENTVMTRTFSKMFGIGGLRLGWAYGPAEVVANLNRVRAPFNVSLVAHDAGLAALAAPGWVEQSRRHNSAERARLTKALHDLGIPVTPSETNFILADFGSPGRAEAADAHLRSRGLIVRRVAGYGLPAHLRITIGTTDECDLVIEALTGFAAARR